jgi:hypothetical protein
LNTANFGGRQAKAVSQNVRQVFVIAHVNFNGLAINFKLEQSHHVPPLAKQRQQTGPSS